jgi:hypothetical protein
MFNGVEFVSDKLPYIRVIPIGRWFDITLHKKI